MLQGSGLHLLRDGGGPAAVPGGVSRRAARDDLPHARAAERDQLARHRQECLVPRAQRIQLQAPENTAPRAPVRIRRRSMYSYYSNIQMPGDSFIRDHNLLVIRDH